MPVSKLELGEKALATDSKEEASKGFCRIGPTMDLLQLLILDPAAISARGDSG